MSSDPPTQQAASAEDDQTDEAKPKKIALTTDEVGDLLKANIDHAMGLVDKVVTENPTSPSTDDTPETDTSIERVLNEKKDVPRVKDLGLGRGVDATDPRPWFNKSSFQVRNVSFDNLLGTEEGGYLRDYEMDVSSVTSQQASMAASIAVSQVPVKIGIEGELSRTVTTTRKVVGKRVVTRTIEFSAQFDDLLPDGITKADTFEGRLSKWVDERIEQSKKDQTRRGDYKTEAVKDCLEFVRHFHITHYVSSITLGATEYLVLSEAEYYTKVSSKGKVGYEPVAQLNASSSFSKKFTSKSSDLQKIGKIVDDKVKRGATDEAVIGTEIQSIHHLVQATPLREALQEALTGYICERKDKTNRILGKDMEIEDTVIICTKLLYNYDALDKATHTKLLSASAMMTTLLSQEAHPYPGPFVIRCGDEKIYWMVERTANGYTVIGTDDPAEASLFSIFPTDDGDHPFEFYIGWNGTKNKEGSETPNGPDCPDSESEKIEPAFRYLVAPLDILGRNHGPLYLNSKAEKEHSRFSIRSRLRGLINSNVNLQGWVKGNDSFFIMCNRRYFRNDGLVAMRLWGTYRTCCVSSTKKHNERDTWMVFRLLSPGKESQGLCNQEPRRSQGEQSSRHTARPTVTDTGTHQPGAEKGLEMETLVQ